MVEGMALGEQVLLGWWFMQSFTLFDMLWVGLAVVTAAKIGANGPGRIALPQPLGADVTSFGDESVDAES